MSSQWDAADRRIKLTYPGTGLYVNTDYLVTGEVQKVRENGATGGLGVLASYAYDNLGNRTGATFGNGTSEAFGYDPVSRLISLSIDLAGTASDLTKTFSYRPSSQIVSETRSNDAYSQVLANGTQTTATNGLNQIATVNGTSAAYDPRGNMVADPVTGKAYTYWGSNNQLRSVGLPFTSLSYDALGRLWHVETPSVTNYVSDAGGAGGASNIIAEYDGSGTLQDRYVFDGTGEPLVQYDGTGARTWVIPDERGSIVAQANDSGAMTAINTYDEYGVPGASNAGPFQYTGQMWLSRAGLYNYRARAYAQHLGVFAQTDPIGQAGGPNIYAYVGADPVNGIDPFGLDCRPSVASGPASSQITITQCNYENAAIEDALAAQAGFTLGNSIIGGIQACRGYCAPIEIRAPRQLHYRSLPLPLPIIIPLTAKADQCIDRAERRNGVALGVDVLGLAADVFLAPEAGAVAAIGLGGAAIVNSSVHREATYAFVGYAGMKSGIGVALLSGRSAAISHGLARFMLGLSTIHDVREAYDDYKTCMAGR